MKSVQGKNVGLTVYSSLEKKKKANERCNITYFCTRSSGHAYMTLNTKCDFSKYSFFPRTIQEWNKLPKEVAWKESITSFKSEICKIFSLHLCI